MAIQFDQVASNHQPKSPICPKCMMNLTPIETIALDPKQTRWKQSNFLGKNLLGTRASARKRLERSSLEERINNAPHVADGTEVPLLRRAKQGSREGEQKIPNNRCHARVLRLFFVSPGCVAGRIARLGEGGTSVTLMHAKFGARTPSPLHLCLRPS